MAGKASRRFYNEALLKEQVYDACLVATENPFDALNTIPADAYYCYEEAKSLSSCWTQSTYVPPPSGLGPPRLSLAQPFHGFDPGKKDAPKSNKKARTNQPKPSKKKDEQQDEQKNEDGEPKKRKRPAPFTRLAELNGQMRTYKVLMLPTRQQKIELKRCFAVGRHAYNFANAQIRRHGARANFIQLRNEWTKQPPLPWASQKKTMVATRIQQHAIKQCVDAYTSNFAKARLDPAHHFEVKYRSLRSTDTEVIVIEKDQDWHAKCSSRMRFQAMDDMPTRPRRSECLLHLGNNLGRFGGIRLQDSKKVIDMLLSESTRLKENAKIQWNKQIDEFYFIYSYVQPKLDDPDPLFEHKRIVATDPGLAPFQEWYSPTSGEYGVLLDGAKPEILKRCKAIDKLQSRIAHRKTEMQSGGGGFPSQRRRERHTRRKQKKRYARTTQRLRRRFRKKCAQQRGWMENGHYAAANFLLQKHEIILQPVLQVSRLAKRTPQRIFGSQTARAMYTWGHYLFRQRLKSAASRYAGRHVYETTEPGTSKTCTHCGFWHADLRLGDKIFDCPRCHIQVDRQLAGARNNFFAAYGLAVGIGWDGRGG